mmetsp:Transcript_122964/g.226495  ORF Transcript_122964/g.226495 Transcript_122964/m.226495 type:complete len:229 (-) Transcript_122964:394-1080(-)
MRHAIDESPACLYISCWTFSIFCAAATSTCVFLGLVVQDCPVKDKIVLVALAQEEVFQQPAQVCIVRAILESQAAAVIEICDKLGWEMLAKHLYWCGHLLLHDFLVFLFLAISFEPLPWQTPSIEVHQDIADSLQIITSTLLNTEMCVYASISCCACEILALSVGDVLLRLRVAVLLCQPKVNDVHLVGLFAQTNEEVVRLDIPVDEILGVHILNTIDHLICKHENSL